MKKVALHTLGCKLNFSETSTIGRQFRERGYEIVGADEPSDIFLMNTCSVTERADRECRQIIRRTLRNSPETFVIVTGCYAQLQPGEVSSIPGVDLVLGTGEKFNVFDHEEAFVKHALPQQFVSCIDEATTFNGASSDESAGRTRAFLKIQDGCDFPCAFCTIPLARGASRSQGIESIVGQARALGAMGYREIVLTGVNVGDYGTNDGTDLLALLKELDQVQEVERFRVSSVEPNLLTRDIIEFVLASARFCNHFHIPLQSGSDTILRAMRRRYTTSHYRKVVEQISSIDPSAGIGVDVIVGFPGESESHFDETKKFLSDLPISYLHVFTYSEREETPAASFDGAVEPRIRQQRSELLRTLGRRFRRTFYESLIGQTHDVLFERNSADGICGGYTSNYARVEASTERDIENAIISTTITSADEEHCRGTLHVPHSSSEGERLSKHSSHNLSVIPNVSYEGRPA